ncbi:hypothetical protein E1262_06970 [Jiangella aurantiaca]|uniref:DUF1579 domain-containing protein n=1 Tax=Jiangella aurantiaca TaxID=2530373 RepID=A0A4R5AFI1_9ACTN|nr:hypothetical protein [Jiangella aurantiaca]TDD71338.1 hypothetical protein E1262_06970 [Jiangella aurantiaca]
MIEKLDALTGAWRSEGETVDDPVVRIEGSDVYEWLPGRYFLVHHVDVTIDGRRYQALEVFGAEGDAVVARAYDSDGETGTMTVRADEAGVVTLTGPASRARLIVAGDGASMAARWDRRDDAGEWRHWMDMRFTRADERRSPAAATP